MQSPFYLTPIPFVKDLKKSLFQNNSAKDKLRSILAKKTIIDIGCGTEEDAKDIQNICINFEVKRYIGIDIQAKADAFDTVDKTEIEIVKSDILEYLEKTSFDDQQLVFILFGLEPAKPKEYKTKEYIGKLLNEISQKTEVNDIILIGNGTHGVYPEDFNFTKIKSIDFGNFHIQQYVKQI